MPLRQRIGVCVLLSAGIIVTIAGVVRTYFIWKSLIDTYDETWFTYPLWICAALEIDIAVVSHKVYYTACSKHRLTNARSAPACLR